MRWVVFIAAKEVLHFEVSSMSEYRLHNPMGDVKEEAIIVESTPFILHTPKRQKQTAARQQVFQHPKIIAWFNVGAYLDRVVTNETERHFFVVFFISNFL